MLFGFGRVSRGMHFLATVIVALGTIISAFWTLAASIVVPLHILIGDLHGLNTRDHQPAKVAAIERNGNRRLAHR